MKTTDSCDTFLVRCARPVAYAPRARTVHSVRSALTAGHAMVTRLAREHGIGAGAEAVIEVVQRRPKYGRVLRLDANGWRVVSFRYPLDCLRCWEESA